MRRIALLAAVLVLAAGCQNDATNPSGSVVGTYQLQVINGQNLPFTFTDNQGNVVRLNADQVTLSANGTYEDDSFVNVNGGPAQTLVETGEYSAVNGSITFTDETDGGIQYGGSVSGTTLTEISGNGSLTEVFQRQ